MVKDIDFHVEVTEDGNIYIGGAYSNVIDDISR